MTFPSIVSDSKIKKPDNFRSIRRILLQFS